MAKQALTQQTTHLNTPNGPAVKKEASLTYEDNILPSPQELEAYKQVDPKIVDFLIESAQKEQVFRHSIENKKIELVGNADRGNRSMDRLGMFLAFLALILSLGVSAFALYLDKPWFAGIFGSGSILGIVSIFIRRGKIADNMNKMN